MEGPVGSWLAKKSQDFVRKVFRNYLIIIYSDIDGKKGPNSVTKSVAQHVGRMESVETYVQQWTTID